MKREEGAPGGGWVWDRRTGEVWDRDTFPVRVVARGIRDEKDARFVAAAPRLHKALRDLVECFYRKPHEQRTDEEWRLVQAAVAASMCLFRTEEPDDVAIMESVRREGERRRRR